MPFFELSAIQETEFSEQKIPPGSGIDVGLLQIPKSAMQGSYDIVSNSLFIYSSIYIPDTSISCKVCGIGDVKTKI